MIGLLIAAGITVAAGAPAPAQEAYERSAHAWLDEHLRDSSDAKVELRREVRFSTVNRGGLLMRESFTGWFACYRVNARNGYGGFTGWKTYAFLIGNEGAVLAVFPAEPTTGQDWVFAQECGTQ